MGDSGFGTTISVDLRCDTDEERRDLRTLSKEEGKKSCLSLLTGPWALGGGMGGQRAGGGTCGEHLKSSSNPLSQELVITSSLSPSATAFTHCSLRI